MHEKLVRIALLGTGLLCAVSACPRAQGPLASNGKPKPAAATQQDRQGKTSASKDKETKANDPVAQKPASNRQHANAAADPQQGSDKQLDRRRAGIASVFPRTGDLLTYLERSDPAAHQAVLRHSAPLTSGREAAALHMAQEHHPELFALIVRSKDNVKFPRAYNAAIRELVADHARILRAKSVGTVEFDATVTEWKLRSQVRLVAARMTVDNQPELQQKLEALLIQGERAKRRLIQLEIQRQQDHIKRLWRRLDQDAERNVERQLRAINKRVTPDSNQNKQRRK